MYKWFMESQDERRRFWKPVSDNAAGNMIGGGGPHPDHPQQQNTATAAAPASYEEQEVADLGSGSESDDDEDAPETSTNPLARLKRTYNQVLSQIQY
jgi:hypothetical protein